MFLIFQNFKFNIIYFLRNFIINLLDLSALINNKKVRFFFFKYFCLCRNRHIIKVNLSNLQNSMCCSL